MGVPQRDSTIGERLKNLEQQLRWIRLHPSLSQSAVEPLAVKGSGWYDTTSGNEPKVFDGTAWVPVRDETIAVAQGTADSAAIDAAAAVADASTALSKFPITATDITDGAISTPKLAADAIDGMVITGALFRTAASGQRIEIDSASLANEIQFFSGAASETAPGFIKSDVVSGGAYTAIASPALSGGSLDVASLQLLKIASTGIVTAILDASVINLDASGGIEMSAATIDLDANDAFGSTVRANGSVVMTVGDNPQPVSTFSATGISAITSTTFIAGTPVVGVSFTAPATGSVWVNVQGHLEQTVAAKFGYLAFEMRDGGTIGSGTVVHTAVTQESVGVDVGRIASSNRTLVTGLTPGAHYNARTMHVCTPATGSLNIFYRSIVVEPVL